MLGLFSTASAICVVEVYTFMLTSAVLKVRASKSIPRTSESCIFTATALVLLLIFVLLVESMRSITDTLTSNRSSFPGKQQKLEKVAMAGGLMRVHLDGVKMRTCREAPTAMHKYSIR